MKNNICYSPESLLDLDEIWDYIMLQLCNPSAAATIINKIQRTIDKLSRFPGMGTFLSEIADTNSDYRFVPSGNYLIFYHTILSNIYIDRILYCKRDYLQILMDYSSEK